MDNGQDLDRCEQELGVPVGQLLTPLTQYRLRDPSRPWAIDNGAFSGFDKDAFMQLLAREAYHQDKCLFVTVPDVVGSARRTLEVFERWRNQIVGKWKIALVCQDGQQELPIPWDKINAIFIGGSTNWKCSHHAVHIIKAAKLLGKWVHVGRVNHAPRYEHFLAAGADSFDGTGLARFSHARYAIRDRHDQRVLL